MVYQFTSDGERVVERVPLTCVSQKAGSTIFHEQKRVGRERDILISLTVYSTARITNFSIVILHT